MEAFNLKLPIYEQLVAKIKRRILAGEYPPNHVLPSRRELAQHYQINPNTVQRAFKQLEEEGLVVTDKNVPSRVTSQEEVIQRLKQTVLKDAVDAFMKEMKIMGITQQEIITYIEHYEERKER